METFHVILGVLGALFGSVTAFLTLYAKYLDVKNAAKKEGANAAAAILAPPTSAPEIPGQPITHPVAAEAVPRPVYLPARDPATIERARMAVKAPATSLIATGILGSICFLVVAGYGFVDNFVMPLSEESRQQHAALEASRGAVPPGSAGIGGADGPNMEAAKGVLTVIACLGFAAMNAVSAVAGIGMLRLRSYWFSMAGSIWIIFGGGFCCGIGLPVGIWSLAVLIRQDVVSSFD